MPPSMDQPNDPDELREQARLLHEQAGDRARAAAELRDAAAALREEAAAFDEPRGEPPAADSSPRRRWFRRRG